MKKLLQGHLLVGLSFIFFLFGCKKDTTTLESVSLNSSTTSKDGFPNTPFNWETSQVMMPSLPQSAYNPSMPWSSQSGSPIDPGIINDYASAEGWVLVYNTFNPNDYMQNLASGGLYFALYNVYRGLLRFYLYIPSGQAAAGTDIQHGLSISSSGPNTSMLNFAGVDIVDPSVDAPYFTETNNTGVAAGGGWYAMQYEIAFDPNFTPSNDVFPTIGIEWNSRSLTVGTITLDGQIAGTITGDVSQQSSGLSVSTIINGVIGIAEVYVEALGTLTGFAQQLQSASSNGLAGNTTSFLSGIFGGNSNTPTEVDLKMNANITLSGTATTATSLYPNLMVFPGESIQANNGSFPPLYTSPLGVFNLTARPTVYVHSAYNNVIFNSHQDLQSYNTTNTFTFDKTMAATLTVNTANVGGAKIALKSALLIATPTPLPIPASVSTNGTLSTISNFSGYFSPTYMTEYFTKGTGDVSGPPKFKGTCYIQVTMLVTPTSSSFTGQAPTITHTFLANILQD